MELPIGNSASLLYQYISTPAGLASWYADDVRTDAEFYTFRWGDTEEKAQVLRQKLDNSIRFHWVEDALPHSFF